MVPSFAFLFILMHSNKFILEFYSGLGTVGIYSIGFNLGMAISVITTGIATAWYPFFMDYMTRQDQAKKDFFAGFHLLFLWSRFFFCVAFFLFAKPIVQALTSDEFHKAWIVIGLVASANFFNAAFNFFSPVCIFTKLSLFRLFKVLLFLYLSH